MSETLNIKKVNDNVFSWTRATRKELQNALQRLNIHATGELLKKLKYSVGKNSGVAERISFKFQEQGVFVEKGVGRSYGIDGPKTATAMLNRARKPKPWFNDTMDKTIPDLANRLKIDLSNEATKQIKIK